MSVRSRSFLAAFAFFLGACDSGEKPASKPRVIRVSPEIERRAVPTSPVPAVPRASSAVSPDPVPEIGRAYRIAIGDRAVIVNRRPISDGYRRFRRGNDCRIEPGGTVTVLGARAAGDPPDTWTEYLVRYARPPKTSDDYVRPQDDAKPYACPDGAVFYHDDPLFISETP